MKKILFIFLSLYQLEASDTQCSALMSCAQNPQFEIMHYFRALEVSTLDVIEFMNMRLKSSTDHLLLDEIEICKMNAKSGHKRLKIIQDLWSEFKKIKLDSDLQCFVSRVLEVRLSSLSNRMDAFYQGVYSSSTYPDAQHQGETDDRRNFNAGQAEFAREWYVCITKICILSLHLVPKESLSELNQLLLRSSVGLCKILKGGEITHPDEVIRFNATFFDYSDGPTDAELYKYYFNIWSYLCVALPSGDFEYGNLINSMMITEEQKEIINDIRMRKKNNQNLKIQLPLILSKNYVERKIKQIEERKLKGYKYDQKSYDHFVCVDEKIKKVMQDGPLPSLDGVDWQVIPFIPMDQFLLAFFPPKPVEKKQQHKVILTKKQRILLSKQEELRNKLIDDVYRSAQSEKSVLFESTIADLNKRVEKYKECLRDLHSEKGSPRDAMRGLLPRVTPAAQTEIISGDGQKKQLDKKWEILVALLQEKSPLYRTFESLWSAVGGSLVSQGGSHRRMYFGDKGFVGIVVEPHHGVTSFGYQTRRYLLEVIEGILPKGHIKVDID